MGFEPTYQGLEHPCFRYPETFSLNALKDYINQFSGHDDSVDNFFFSTLTLLSSAF